MTTHGGVAKSMRETIERLREQLAEALAEVKRLVRLHDETGGTCGACGCRAAVREELRRQAEAPLAEARAEVGRLTAERASVPHLGLKIRAEQAEAALAAERDALHGTALKLEAERERSERLRTALERYVSDDGPCEYGGGDDCPGVPAFAPCKLHQARAALAPAQPEEPKGAEVIDLMEAQVMEAQHQFQPCRLEHNFTCALLCVICGLPREKHAPAQPEEKQRERDLQTLSDASEDLARMNAAQREGKP